MLKREKEKSQTHKTIMTTKAQSFTHLGLPNSCKASFSQQKVRRINNYQMVRKKILDLFITGTKGRKNNANEIAAKAVITYFEAENSKRKICKVIIKHTSYLFWCCRLPC